MAEVKKTGIKPASQIKPKAEVKEELKVEAGEVVVEVSREEIVVKKVVNEEIKRQPAQTSFSPTDLISCKSVTDGLLLLPGSKSGILYQWYDFGQTVDVEYQDVMQLVLSRSRYVFEPLLVVEDENFISQRKDLSALYETMYDVNYLDDIFNLDLTEFKRILNSLPIGIANSVRTLAATKIQDGTLDSLQKIKAIDEILKTELSLYIE